MLRLSPKRQQTRREGGVCWSIRSKSAISGARGVSPIKQQRATEGGLSMDIWFKAKVDWGEALGLLSDTEAGRFAKALWKYAATGDAAPLAGREQMLFALVLADLRREAEHRERLSALRSEAGRRGGRPRAQSKTSNGFSPEAPPGNQSEEESSVQNPEAHRIQSERTQTSEPDSGCAEVGSAASVPLITLPLNDGSEWPVSPELADQWRLLYPAVDVDQALRSMRGWLLANRPRRKTARGIERFAAAWLAREQDRGGGGAGGGGGGGVGGAGFARGPKRVQEQMYEQRRYDPAEFDELSPEQLEMLGLGGDEDER